MLFWLVSFTAGFWGFTSFSFNYLRLFQDKFCLACFLLGKGKHIHLTALKLRGKFLHLETHHVGKLLMESTLAERSFRSFWIVWVVWFKISLGLFCIYLELARISIIIISWMSICIFSRLEPLSPYLRYQGPLYPDLISLFNSFQNIHILYLGLSLH